MFASLFGALVIVVLAFLLATQIGFWWACTFAVVAAFLYGWALAGDL